MNRRSIEVSNYSIPYCAATGASDVPSPALYLIAALDVAAILLNLGYVFPLWKMQIASSKRAAMTYITLSVVMLTLSLIPRLLITDVKRYSLMSNFWLAVYQEWSTYSYRIVPYTLVIGIVERYIAICKAGRYGESVFVKHIFKFMIVISVAILIPSFLTIVLQNDEVCILDGYGPTIADNFELAVIYFCCFTVIPASFISYFLARILLKLRLLHRIRNSENPEHMMAVKYFLTTATTYVLFLFFPRVFFLFGRAGVLPVSTYNGLLILIFHTVFSLINPILYYLVNREYREQVNSYLCLVCGHMNTVSVQ